MRPCHTNLPAMALFVQAFMLYMSGGGVQILSMGIVLTFLFTPFENIAGMNAGALLYLSVCTMLIFRRSVCSILTDVI